MHSGLTQYTNTPPGAEQLIIFAKTYSFFYFGKTIRRSKLVSIIFTAAALKTRRIAN